MTTVPEVGQPVDLKLLAGLTGEARQKAYLKLWRKSARGRRARREYNARPEVKAGLKVRKRRYSQSAKGKATTARCLNRYYAKPQWQFKYYKRNARIRGISFGLDFAGFLEYQGKPCHYCGDVAAKGVDRVNNQKGYAKGNVVSCCARCNYMKREMDMLVFLEHCYSVVRHMGFGVVC